MYIHNDFYLNYPSANSNYLLKSLDTTSSEQINQNSIKYLKFLSQPMRKSVYETLSTKEICNLMFPPSLLFYIWVGSWK